MMLSVMGAVAGRSPVYDVDELEIDEDKYEGGR